MFDFLKKQSHTILIVLLILGITMGIIAVILGLTMKVTGTMIASFVLCFLSIIFIICAGYNLMYHEKTTEHMSKLKKHLGKDLGPMSKYTDPVTKHLGKNIELSKYIDPVKAHLNQQVTSSDVFSPGQDTLSELPVAPAPVSTGSQEVNDPDSMRAIGGYFRYGD